MNTQFLGGFSVPHQQEGAVLFVALMLLIILTMVGISAIESTKLETRMAANLREYNHALQAAEIGLSTARSVLGNDEPTIRKIYEDGIPSSTILDNVKRDSISGNYQITYTIVAAEGTYNNAAMFKTKASQMNSSVMGSGNTSNLAGNYVKFLITSTGRSTAETNAAEVVLKGGLEKLIPK
jgi:Tfp pilus assembly protein PilX